MKMSGDGLLRKYNLRKNYQIVILEKKDWEKGSPEGTKCSKSESRNMWKEAFRSKDTMVSHVEGATILG